MLGVLMILLPDIPSSPFPISSVRTIMTLGWLAWHLPMINTFRNRVRRHSANGNLYTDIRPHNSGPRNERSDYDAIRVHGKRDVRRSSSLLGLDCCTQFHPTVHATLVLAATRCNDIGLRSLEGSLAHDSSISDGLVDTCVCVRTSGNEGIHDSRPKWALYARFVMNVCRNA